MIKNIKIPLGSIKENTTYGIKVTEDAIYPLLTIDKGSYIVDANIETGIDMNVDEGLHSIQIGKYCSLAENIVFMVNLNHDYLSVYQGIVFLVEDEHRRKSKIRKKGQIIIENDCWIGHGVTIMSGVTIHNGAVIGAHAMVTKDVPAYAIAGGNPAKIIGYRFDEVTIKKLLSIAWWDWSEEKKQENKEYLRASVDAFVNKFYVKEDWTSGFNPIKRLTDGKLFVYYLDMQASFSLWEKIIHEFIVKYENTENELLLYINPKEENFEINSMRLLDKLGEYSEKECYINIFSEILDDDTVLLNEADYYITNRLTENIHRMCKAELVGVVCVSGVNTDVFYGID